MITPRLAVIRYPEFFGAEDDMVSSLEYFLDKERLSNGQIMLTAENVHESQRETKILHVLRRALTEDGFEVYYQPIYGVKEGQFTMAEALLRLKIHDEELGYIGPDEFIPIAERNGMIVDIGGIVLEQVCRFLSGEQAKKLGIQSIEVNLSVVQCTQSDFADSVSEVLKRYGVSGRQISFEVTETASHKSMEPLLKNMSKLIACGCSFAVDDFGTGFSTTKYLISLPVDMVKIDKSILWAAMGDQAAMTVLRQTVSMLKALNKRIVVEGVETAAMLTAAEEMGCGYVQGYYYSHPLTQENFVSFMRESLSQSHAG